MWDLIVSVPDHCLSFYSLLISVRRLSHLFSIAGYLGSWQFNTVMTGDECGSISLRISVFDCNWQSKLLFF